MPFIRVIRDKRGYETTYLMHWYREGNRQRSKILYVFRTPGSARVGRDALEPEVLRTLEAQYPDIGFDWKTVLENRQVIETTPELRRPKRRRSEDAPEAKGSVAEAAAAPVAEAAAVAPVPRPSIPSAIEGTTPDEQIEFLNSWYPRVRERIVQRITDPARHQALMTLADRLNPAAWTDADQITSGLQQAAEALERLSRVLARRRRRARKPSRGGDRTDAAADVPGQSSTPDESDQ